jgi:hypothetical protein
MQSYLSVMNSGCFGYPKDDSFFKEEYIMGKKHRNRINGQKKNNHIPADQIIAEHEAHGKEYSANKRKK